MATIPKPAQTDGCISVGGLTVCPHVVYLTKSQSKTIHKMHGRNVVKMRTLERAAKAKGRARKSKAKS
jgi:hypothetical protein